MDKNELLKADTKAFMERIRAGQALSSVSHGRLIFALDATRSREPTWDSACKLTADMFGEIKGLSVKLVYFRGISECQQSGWISDPAALRRLMERIACRGGPTQIRKVLDLALKEDAHAVAFIGDALEGPEEHGNDIIDELCAKAARLKFPAFMFQEGTSPKVESAFREIARLSKGAYCRFDSAAVRQFRDLLQSVAAFATGGLQMLEDLSKRNPTAKLLLGQMKK
jgi:hypothetical protein